MPKNTSDNQVKNHLKELLLLFSVPVGVVVLVVSFLYVPRLFANPTHDFIYCAGYSCESQFTVGSDGKITSSPENARPSFRDHRLYHYDTDRDAMRPIELDDAQDYTLDSSSKSPEGYTLERGTNNGGFLFGGGYESNWSLKRGIANKPTSLSGSDITFIGWVL